MKRIEEVYRELLYESTENKRFKFTQSELSKNLDMSLSVISLALKPLRKMNAIEIKRRSFNVIDTKKILYHWASIRNIKNDITYATRVEKPIRKIESEMPAGIIFGAYSAYKLKFRDIPADYSEVYVYSEDSDEIKKRFVKNNSPPNLFVLKKDKNMKKATIAQVYVDLWNLSEWYAKDFLDAMEKRWNSGTQN